MKPPAINPDLVLDNSFIGRTPQICVVTSDFEATLKSYADGLGIGPWWCNQYAPPDLGGGTFRGKPVEISLNIGLAWTGDTNWEIIQPLTGESIYTEFLERTGGRGGVHHVGFYLSDFETGWDETIANFVGRGLTIVQEGGWRAVRWVYFESDDPAQPHYELIDRPADWVRPAPQRWYPHPPAD